jgi:multiple sugar transport system ATP-binding protein
MSLADVIVVMERGAIRQVGAPQDVYDRPADLFVARFVGSPGMNFIEGAIDDRGLFVSPGLTLPLGAAAPLGRATLGIRPEHVRLDPTGPLVATIEHDEYMGSHRFLHVRGEFGTLAMRVAVDREITAPTQRLSFDPAHLNFFDAEGRRR